MVFHEITRPAIERALDEHRVRSTSASSTRRRRGASSTGSTATRSRPCSGRRSMPRLSAGRVQSVATRLVVEREQERMRSSSAVVLGPRGHVRSRARSRRGSSSVDGKRVAQGRDFGPDGQLKADLPASTRTRRASLAAGLDGADVLRPLGRREAVHAAPGAAVHDLDAAAGGEPQAPLHGADDDARRPAALRARLHHLHAHRLDVAVGVGADRGARGRRRELFGAESVPAAPRLYDRQGQERAGGARGDPPGRRPLPHAGRGREASSTATSSALYELVWRRTLASQMVDARGQTVSLRLGATSPRTAATRSSAPPAR